MFKRRVGVDGSKVISRKRVLFVLLFGFLALVSQSVNFSQLVGSKSQFFTFFQFIGPIAGGFLGPVAGVASVLLAQVGGIALLGKPFDFISVLRLTPMLFAAVYFANYKQKHNWFVPLLAIAAFLLHPVGGQAWYYSLYWLIPVVAALLPENLFLRSLGATFTAHAVGGVIWLYTFAPELNTPAYWTALIPIVAYERFLFAAGIAVSFVVFNTVLHKLEHWVPNEVVSVDARYVLSRQGLGVKA